MFARQRGVCVCLCGYVCMHVCACVCVCSRCFQSGLGWACIRQLQNHPAVFAVNHGSLSTVSFKKCLCVWRGLPRRGCLCHQRRSRNSNFHFKLPELEEPSKSWVALGGVRRLPLQRSRRGFVLWRLGCGLLPQFGRLPDAAPASCRRKAGELSGDQGRELQGL